MRVSNAARAQLQSKGKIDPSDLVDFVEEAINVVSKNLRKYGGRIPDLDPSATEGATIKTLPFAFGAKS